MRLQALHAHDMQTQDFDWDKIRDIFEKARQIEGADLEAFLLEACGGDVSLRAEVEKLLAADAAADEEGFLEQPVISPLPQATESLGRTVKEMTAQTAIYEAELQGIERRIGSWRLKKLIGRGGMGAVYLADRADGAYQQKAAIKLLNPGTGSDIISRFRQERQILANLSHPNIARILDGGTLDGMPWVAMEYVEGQSLRKVLSSQGQLPLNQVVEITKQMCAGLNAAHERGVIHRDIKPENVMIDDEDGTLSVKILDFGISKLHGDEIASTDTQTGVILGTPAYMSPEQASGMTGDKIDARSDVYSAGMVVYEMLTGKPAFEGKSILDVLIQQKEKKPAPLRWKCPEIPTRIEEVILRALEKAPDKRPQNVTQLAEQLEAAYSDAAEQKGRTWWRSITPVLLSLLLILLLVFVIKEATRTPGPAPPPHEENKSSAGLLRYAVFRQATDHPSQMLDGNQVHEGDKIHFEFTLPFPGAVYLLFKGKDGALVWVNPKAGGLPQTGPAGQELRAPEKDGINMGEEPGIQEYLAVYVPIASQWSLLDLIAPQELDLRQPVRRANFQHAFISGEAASRVAAYLEKNASRVSFPIPQTQGKDASLAITPGMSEKILFHTITLKQASKN